MKKRISITTDFYFSTSFMFFAALLLIGAGVAFLDFRQPLISALMLLTSLVIFTARYRFTLNLIDHTYFDYLWIAGFKHGEKGKFSSISGMHLTKNAYRQNINSGLGGVNSMTKRGIEYNGYIRLDDQDIHLLSDDKRSKVVKKLEKIQRVLKGNIIRSTQITINSDITDHSEN